MTQAQQILDYLWSIAPAGATNRQIGEALGIRSHQTVYMATQDLALHRRIRGEQAGKTWYFYALDTPELELARTPAVTPDSGLTGGTLSPAEFEALARRAMCQYYGITRLSPGQVDGVPKKFDFASPDGQIVGDAKYYTRVGGRGLPPAKFSIIAEHVWLLEKTKAREKFLVFGNDREVPVLWLKRYGGLVSDVAFFFLHPDRGLELLNGSISEQPSND